MRQHQKWPERAEGSVTRARVQRTRMFVPMTCLVRAAASIDGHITAAWTARHQTRYLRAAWRQQQHVVRNTHFHSDFCSCAHLEVGLVLQECSAHVAPRAVSSSLRQDLSYGILVRESSRSFGTFLTCDHLQKNPGFEFIVEESSISPLGIF